MSASISAINPQKYGKLLARVRPTVIRTEEENNRLLALVEQLMTKGDNLTPEEGELLRLLGKLIADFEVEFYHLEDAEPHEVRAMDAVGAQEQQDDDVQDEKSRHVRPFSNTLTYLELSFGCNSLHALVLPINVNYFNM